MDDFRKEMEVLRHQLAEPVDMEVPDFTDAQIAQLPNILQLIQLFKDCEFRFVNDGGWMNERFRGDYLNTVFPGVDSEYCNNAPNDAFIVNR